MLIYFRASTPWCFCTTWGNVNSGNCVLSPRHCRLLYQQTRRTQSDYHTVTAQSVSCMQSIAVPMRAKSSRLSKLTEYGVMPSVAYTYTVYTHPFNGPFSGTTRVSRYQKGKTNLDFTGARDSEWQCHQLGHMQVCTSLQTDNHASTPLLKFFTGRMPFLPPNQQRQSTEGSYAVEQLK